MQQLASNEWVNSKWYPKQVYWVRSAKKNLSYLALSINCGTSIPISIFRLALLLHRLLNSNYDKKMKSKKCK